MDILQSALDADDRSHMMVALPTGYGKTMPMLLLGHLLPAGRNHLELQKNRISFFLPGSITIVVTPTTTIGQQLVADCRKLGIDAVSSGVDSIAVSVFVSSDRSSLRHHALNR